MRKLLLAGLFLMVVIGAALFFTRQRNRASGEVSQTPSTAPSVATPAGTSADAATTPSPGVSESPVPTSAPGQQPAQGTSAAAPSGATGSELPQPAAAPGTNEERTTAAKAIEEELRRSGVLTKETADAKQEAYVAARIDELADLGMEDDAPSLATILSELTNRDPRIRQAAVDAAVQFGSRDAVPRLQDAAAQTDDPTEKAAIMEAIEFLNTPTLSEAVAAQTNQPSR